MTQEELKNELLYKMQNSFPMTQKPFLELAKEFGVSEEAIIKLVQELKEQKVIRQTSAIFDTKRLGYKSSLVAFKVEEHNIPEAVEAINAHPGVSHNYLRDHDFNIWFTLAVAPDSALGLEKTVEILAQKSLADQSIILPTLKMFKISVKMDTTGKRAKKERLKKLQRKDIELNTKHIALIKELQKDIQITSEPFKEAKEKLGVEYSELFSLAQELQESGVMRRFATILHHRKAGFSANAMSVWDAPKKSAVEIGEKLTSYSAVSHCYLRPKSLNWPYNIFAMVHAKSEEESNALIEEMAQETGLKNYTKLYSTKEFKKVRIEYFSPRFKEWEEANL